MSWAWHMLISLGVWAQEHQALMLASSGTVIVVLGMARFGWRMARAPRRPWR